MKFENVKVRIKICYIIAIAAILVISLQHIKELYMPRIAKDEFGYWSTAAFLYGYDWSGITSAYPYYSWGVGIIILPLMKLFNNPLYVYSSMIAINGIILCVTFWIIIKVINSLFSKTNQYFCLLIAFFLTCSASNLLYSQLVWAETFLTIIYWLLLLLLLKFFEKPNRLSLFCISFLTFAMYIIHQRTIGICISVLLVMLILKFFKKINLKDIFLFTIVIFIGFFFQNNLKSYFESNLWFSEINLNYAVNDYNGQIEKILTVFSFTGLKYLFESLCGKIYYFNNSTFYLFPFSLIFCLREIIQVVRRKKLTLIGFFCIVVFLGVGSTIMISAIYMLGPGRIDTLLYGRYAETVLGPMMLLGLYELLFKKDKIIKFLSISIAQFTLTYYVYVILSNYRVSNYVAVNSPYMNLFTGLNGGGNYIFIYYASILAFLVMGCIIMLLQIFSNRKVIQILSVFCLFSMSVVVAVKSREAVIYNQGWIDNKNSVVSNVKLLEEIDIQELFYLETEQEDSVTFIAMYQFLMPDVSIKPISLEEALKKEDFCLLIEPNQYKYLKSNFDVTGKKGWIYLIAGKESQLLANLEEKSAQIVEIVDLDKMQKGIANTEIDRFSSYGPYITLQKGTYIVDMEFTGTEGQENLGYCDINDNGQIYSAKFLTEDNLTDGKLSMSFYLPVDKYEVEFRTFLYAGKSAEVNNISYQRISPKCVLGLDDDGDYHIIKKIIEENSFDNIYVLNDGYDNYSIDYISEERGFEQNIQYLTKEEIQAEKDASLVIAPQAEYEWIRLLENFVVVERLNKYVLLLPNESAVLDDYEDQIYSHGRSTEIKLWQLNNEVGYEYNTYGNIPSGKYNAVLELLEDREMEDGEAIVVDIKSNKRLINQQYVAYNKRIEIPLILDGKVSQLAFAIKDKYGEEYKYSLVSLEVIEDFIEYNYKYSLNPLIESIKNTSGNLQILVDSENGNIIDIKKYLSLCDLGNTNVVAEAVYFGTEVHPDTSTRYLIVPNESRIFFPLLEKGYQITKVTDSYVLLDKQNENTISNYSDGMVLLRDYFGVNTVLPNQFNIPRGVYKISMNIQTNKKELKESYGEIVVTSDAGSNSRITLTPQLLEAGFVDIYVSTIRESENYSIKIIEEEINSIQGNLENIEKISDGILIPLTSMGIINGEINELSIVTEGADSSSIIYGPYISLEPGNYEVTFGYETHSNTSMDFDVVYKGATKVLYEKNVNSFAGKEEMVLAFTVDELAEDVEFRMMIPANAKVNLNYVILNNLE